MLKVKRLTKTATLPTRATQGSAGYDISVDISAPITLRPNEPQFISTGISIEIAPDTVGLVYPRSGLSCRHGITLANSVGVIDSDYRGEISVCLVNNSSEPYTIEPNQRVAQLVISPILTPEVEEVESISDTTRGANGYGSTGK